MLFLGHASITLGLGSLLDFGLRKKYGSAFADTTAVNGKAKTIRKPLTSDPPPGTMAKIHPLELWQILPFS